MKHVQNFDQFVNEEFNWKKGVAGLALAGTLMGGMTSCNEYPIAIDTSGQPVLNQKFVKKGNVMNARVASYTHSAGKSTVTDHFTVLLIKLANGGRTYKVIIKDGDSRKGFWTLESRIKRGDEVQLEILGNQMGRVIWKGETFELNNKYWCKGDVGEAPVIPKKDKSEQNTNPTVSW